MYKASLTVLGIGLFAMFVIVAGLGIRPWLIWMDGGLGILSLGCAAYLVGRPIEQARGLGASILFLFSAGLIGTWIAALIAGSLAWLVWSTFGFACLYFINGFGALTSRPRGGAERIAERKAA